ncbi:MAG: Zn-dependent hydrolase [Solirubrobacteraceae bacterium]
MTPTDVTAGVSPIDAERLWSGLRAAAEIGAWRRPGVQRLALSDADRQMRDRFTGWCRDSGLEVRVDRIGNIFARRPGTEAIEPVMIGSHLDTQVAGGRYDGVLGVLAGLEIVRWLNDHGLSTRRPVEVVSWTNEEGARFRPAMLGSAAFTGAIELQAALDQRDDDGRRLADELERIGYAGGDGVPGKPPHAYFELHIEQGDVLDRRAVDLGIVTGAYPARGVEIRVRGATAHAGATPMRLRRDALAGAAEMITAIETLATQGGGDGRTTTTRLEVWPNATGIVPAEVMLSVDYRHTGEAELERMATELEREVTRIADRRELDVSWDQLWEFGEGVTFDAELAAIARRHAGTLGVEALQMHSAAGHDAYWLATVAPVLLLFVPCVDGITHNEHEEIEFHRVLRGVNVLAASVLEVANRPGAEG